MITRDYFEIAVDQIPYKYRHPLILHGLIRWLEPKIVIEIGTHIGFTACWLARGLQENGQGHLFCIDPFCWIEENQKEQWFTNISNCGVEGVVTLIQGRSQEVVWPIGPDLVYVDGNHTYEVCKYDVERSRELGASCIVLHDTVSWEGSRKYSEEMREDDKWRGWDFLEAEFECGLLIVKKRFPKGFCEGVDIGERWDVCS
jgi:predicted O-methyltransferase YrrM